MNLEFHYYATYVAARLAKFSKEKARIIAYAAQLVDDFTSANFPMKELKTCKAFFDCPPKYTCFSIDDWSQQMSQAMKGDKELANIWIPFHFLPCLNPKYFDNLGIKKSIDDGIKKLMCAPSGILFDDMVNSFSPKEDISNKELVRLGLNCHILEDTFSHWGFVGFKYEKVNGVTGYPTELSGESMRFDGEAFTNAVAIGHVPLKCYPDDSFRVISYAPHWREATKEEPFITRENPLAFYNAFKTVYALLKTRNTMQDDEKFNIEEIMKDVENIIKNCKTRKDEETAWKALIAEKMNDKNMTDYNIKEWKDAFIANPNGEGLLIDFCKCANEHWLNVNKKAELDKLK